MTDWQCGHFWTCLWTAIFKLSPSQNYTFSSQIKLRGEKLQYVRCYNSGLLLKGLVTRISQRKLKLVTLLRHMSQILVWYKQVIIQIMCQSIISEFKLWGKWRTNFGRKCDIEHLANVERSDLCKTFNDVEVKNLIKKDRIFLTK